MTPDRHLLRVGLISGIAAALCLYASVAHCQDRPMKVTIAAYAGLATADLVLTTPCVRNGSCRERNPALKPVAGSYAGMAAAKAAGVTVFSAMAWKLRTRHPRLAWGILGSVTAAQGAVVVYNARQGRQR